MLKSVAAAPSLLTAVLLAAATASAQPVLPDSVARRPPFSVPVTGDFAPPQTSAAVAYLSSVAATAGPIVAGIALNDVLGADPETGSERPAVVTLVLAGAWVGPHVGNLTLGAGGDARRGFALTAGGFLSGVALAGVAVVIAGTCALDDIRGGEIGSGDTCADGPVVVGLLVTGAALAAAGTVAGTAYALVTIPRNADRAQRYRRAYPRVSVAPSWGAGGPAASVRVGL